MDTKAIVGYLISDIVTRPEYIALAVDRGLGKGMHIEKWILTEMLAKLARLKQQGVVTAIEGEHKFPTKVERKFENCDLWWIQDSQEHWLEVKTVMPSVSGSQWSSPITADLDKCNRLRPTDKFHHVTFLFPAVESSVKSWSAQVGRLYTDCGLEFEASWNHPVGNQLLLVFLHTKPRAMMGT